MTQSADWFCDIQLRDFRRISFKNSAVTFLGQHAPAAHAGFAPEAVADLSREQGRNGTQKRASMAHGSEQASRAGMEHSRAQAGKARYGCGRRQIRRSFSPISAEVSVSYSLKCIFSEFICDKSGCGHGCRTPQKSAPLKIRGRTWLSCSEGNAARPGRSGPGAYC